MQNAIPKKGVKDMRMMRAHLIVQMDVWSSFPSSPCDNFDDYMSWIK